MGVSEPRAAEGLVSREDIGKEAEFGGQKNYLQGLRQRVLHADQVEKVLLLLSLRKSRLPKGIITAGA